MGSERTQSLESEAKDLDELRNRWLDPPEWTRGQAPKFSGSADGPRDR